MNMTGNYCMQQFSHGTYILPTIITGSFAYAMGKSKLWLVVVSAKGVANGLSEEYNDGWGVNLFLNISICIYIHNLDIRVFIAMA